MYQSCGLSTVKLFFFFISTFGDSSVACIRWWLNGMFWMCEIPESSLAWCEMCSENKTWLWECQTLSQIMNEHFGMQNVVELPLHGQYSAAIFIPRLLFECGLYATWVWRKCGFYSQLSGEAKTSEKVDTGCAWRNSRDINNAVENFTTKFAGQISNSCQACRKMICTRQSVEIFQRRHGTKCIWLDRQS